MKKYRFTSLQNEKTRIKMSTRHNGYYYLYATQSMAVSYSPTIPLQNKYTSYYIFLYQKSYMHTQKPLTLIKRNDRHMKIDTQMSMKCVDIIRKKLNKLNITQGKKTFLFENAEH